MRLSLKLPEPAHAPFKILEAVSDSLLSVFFPAPCACCKDIVESRRLGSSCAACWLDTKLFTTSDTLCAKCGAFLHDTPSGLNAECGLCREHHYDFARAVGPYDSAIRSAVIRLKSTPVLDGHLKTQILSAFERCAYPEIDLVIPVPLSKKRRIERGYNQAEVIGRFLARQTGILFDGSTLERSRHSPMHRVAMDRKARELTVKNTFSVLRPRLIAGKSILLVDDVFTSGATTSNCAKILKKNGADKVYVFTLARAILFS